MELGRTFCLHMRSNTSRRGILPTRRIYEVTWGGHSDTSRPDEIQNPKLHLKHLLRKSLYTARVSEEIARKLDAGTIAGRSPSFKNFVDALTDGGL